MSSDVESICRADGCGDNFQMLTKKDFQSPQEVKWCPGCGDYGILSQVQNVLPKLGIPREKIVFVSGIGCSSRFPYYLNTYGIHGIHGRAPAIAMGLKCARPDLSVWVVTGDGDSLSIGTNHLIHCLRRNLDVNILLLNNQIYGLTKGQYSPTSEFGKKTKSSPLGTIEQPIQPVALALAAEATFVARSVFADQRHLGEILEAAARHTGTSFVEIRQSCIVFNEKMLDGFTDPKVRQEQWLYMQPGQPLRFGPEGNKGIKLCGNEPRVVDVGPGGVPPEELLVHDPLESAAMQSYLLASLLPPEFPTPLGIFRQLSKPTYDELLMAQGEAAVAANGPGELSRLFNAGTTWAVE